MTSLYVRYELLRTLRNPRMFVFSMGMPLLLFCLIALPNRNQTLGGLPFATYYMAGMISWGSMTAVLAGGARIAMERSVGWNRQLRTTPLRPRDYLGAKVASGYLMAIGTIVALGVAGVAAGVRLDPGHWAALVGMTLIGLIPFAALGVALGHLLRTDTFGPALGGTTSILALLGGAWGPIAPTGALHTVSTLLPSYWLVQAAGYSMAGELWPGRGWLVIGVWTAAFIRLGKWAYAKDTGRE